MRTFRTITSILALIALTIAGFAFTSDASSQILAEKYEVVIELERGVDVQSAAAGFVEAANIPEADRCWIKAEPVGNTCRLNHTYERVLNGFSVFLTDFEITRAHDLLESNGLGIHAISGATVFGLPVVAESLSTLATSALTTNEIVPAGVQRISGGLADGSNVGVAVLDTGGATDHPDVNWGEGYDCTGNVRTDGLPAYYDGHGHGTHVAGTIAAKSNGSGVVGVSPGATIYPVKVLTDQGSGTYASIICGLEWAAQHDDVVSIVNMSLGGGGVPTACGEEDSFHNAVCVLTESVIVVVAAGNSGLDAVEFSPANYPEVVTVSAYTDFDGTAGGFALPPAAGCRALSNDDALATFSNTGELVDVAAPGVCVLSTIPGGEYAYMSGTSMASPHFAGCLAGFLSRNPDQLDHAVDQVLTYSQSRSLDQLTGDIDGSDESLAYCNAVPRWQGE